MVGLTDIGTLRVFASIVFCFFGKGIVAGTAWRAVSARRTLSARGAASRGHRFATGVNNDVVVIAVTVVLASGAGTGLAEDQGFHKE